MTFPHASAQEWAEDHSLAADVRFGRLESIAFQRHPDIFRWFGVDGASAAERVSRPAPTTPGRILVWLTAVAAIIGIIAPIGAVAALGGDRFNFFRMDAESSVPLAGMLFIVAALTQAVVLVLWAVRGARWDPLVTAIVVVALIFSGFGLFAMPNSAAYDGFTGWQIWYPAVIASFVISLVSTIAMFVRFRVRTPEKVAESAPTPAAGESLSSAGVAIDALPTAERDAIRTDRDNALEILHSRGIIDEAILERALAHDLGTLFLLDDATPGGPR